MHRFYADPERSDGNVFVLTPEDTLHALKVLRMKEGDLAEIIFGGNRCTARIIGTSDSLVRLSPEDPLLSAEPALSVTLFQGLPKGDKMEWIVQKAVELGAVKIVPVAFSRCVVRLNEKDGEKKRERWQKIAREAGKQSGRCVIPEVSRPVSFKELPSLFAACEQVAVPWEECPKGGPLAFAKEHPNLRSLGIVIGPEGGITPEEMTEMTAAGAQPLTLGKRILRTETASLAALSVFLGFYGEME